MASDLTEDLTDAQIDALDTFVLHAMAPRGRQSVRDFARAVLAAQRAAAPGSTATAPEGGLSVLRAEKTVIGLDYDGTITRDPDMWFEVMKTMQAQGHEVHIVTMRHGVEATMDLTPMETRFLEGADGVHFTGNSETWDRDAKRPHMDAKGIRVHVWIDDNPKAVHMSARQIWGWCTKPGEIMLHSAPEVVGADITLSGQERKTDADVRPAADDLLQAMRHVEGAAMDIRCERPAIRDGARAAITAYLAAKPVGTRVRESEIGVDKMVESVNGVSWWPYIQVGTRKHHTNKYGANFENRANWEAALLRWVLLGAEKPTIRDYMDSEAISGVAPAAATPSSAPAPTARGETEGEGAKPSFNGIKIRCANAYWASKVQILLRDMIGVKWGDNPRMAIPWNTARLWLTVRQSTTGRWLLSWTPQREFDAISLPEWDAQALIAAAPRSAA
jgi:hypothetical protein